MLADSEQTTTSPDGDKRLSQLLEVAQIAQSYYSPKNLARLDTRLLQTIIALVDEIVAGADIDDDEPIRDLLREKDRIEKQLAKIQDDTTPPVYEAVTRLSEITGTMQREARPACDVRRELAGVAKTIDAVMATIEQELPRSDE